MQLSKWLFLIVLCLSCSTSQSDEDDLVTECFSDQELYVERRTCDTSLPFSPEVTLTVQGGNRVLRANNIPDHAVGSFGQGQGGPNSISPQNKTYNITMNPQISNVLTPLLGNNGPRYSFGILLNGVEVDPIAAEPFPHEGVMSPLVNWDWNLEALNVRIGLDCNNAHVQPSGKYHYHGTPTLYLESLNLNSAQMNLVGYAADGFPIYYKYAYSDPNNMNSEVVEMTSSFQLKAGKRPGDGITAPCGAYNGVYSNDYEYIPEFGSLDEANGREGVTPEFPEGTYYYVITDAFPSIPRYFRGTPSNNFGI